MCVYLCVHVRLYLSHVCLYALLHMILPFLWPLPYQAPGGLELSADYWELVGGSPAGGAENLVNEESHIDVQLDQRHMMLRGDAVRGWS